MTRCNFCYYKFTNFLWLRSQCPHCNRPLGIDPLDSHRIAHQIGAQERRPAMKLSGLPELPDAIIKTKPSSKKATGHD